MGRLAAAANAVVPWPRGFWCGRRSGGKKWTPAITLPQMRQGIAVLVREALQCGTRSQMLAGRQKPCGAMSLPASLIGNSVTNWLHCIHKRQF